MASYFKRLDITPGLLDLGTLVVRLEQVSSVGRAERRPLRWLGVVLLIISLLLLGFEAMFNLMAFSLKTKGSVKIWAACGAAGIGFFSLIYAQRCFAITLAGGSRILLRISSQTFADQLLSELRRAMSAGAGTNFHIVADLVAETILDNDPGDVHPARSALPAVAAGPAAALPHQRPGNGAAPAPLQGVNAANWSAPHGGPGLIEAGKATVHPEFYPHQVGPYQAGRPMPNGALINGAAVHGATAPAGTAMLPRTGPGGPHYAQARGAMPVNGGHGAMMSPPHAQQPSLAGPGPGAPRFAIPSGNRDLAQLIDFILRSEIQHKDALLELLRVVEDHELGGRTSREDALAHWQSFSEYVVQYLASVEGLPLLTAQAARSLTRFA